MDTKRSNTGPIAPFYLFVCVCVCVCVCFFHLSVVPTAHFQGYFCAQKLFLSAPLIYRPVASGFSIRYCDTNSEKLTTADNEKHEYCE